MPRAAKLSKRGAYWFTKAGAPSGVYFGRTDTVPRDEAVKRFRNHLASLAVKAKAPPAETMTVAALAIKFGEYLEAHRSRRL